MTAVDPSAHHRDPDGDAAPHRGERLIRRSDVVIGVILIGIPWSWVSFSLTAVEFLLGDAVRPGAPDWAVEVMIIVAPITTVVALIGVLVRRRWVRWSAGVATAALVALWVAARVVLAPYWGDPLLGVLFSSCSVEGVRWNAFR